MESFFDTPAARWDRLDQRLHVYVLPNESVAEYAELFQREITSRGIDGLSIQHRPWLHMTIQIINRHADELGAGELENLTSALDDAVSTVDAFGLTAGPALAGGTAITLDATPDQPWRQLRTAVRAAATVALGPAAVPPLNAPGRPHITLGYAQKALDIQPHLGWLAHRRHGRALMSVERVHLVSVTQDPQKGLFTWEHIHEAGLKGCS